MIITTIDLKVVYYNYASMADEIIYGFVFSNIPLTIFNFILIIST